MAEDFEELYPEASRAATECAMNLVKTGDMIASRVGQILRPLGLSPAGGLVLSLLADAPAPLSPRQLEERLLVKGPTVTGLLDSLERSELVERQRDSRDRRRINVVLTPAGRQVANAFRPQVHRAQKPWLECLSPAEQEDLIRLLGRIQDHLASE